jgi:hypothetical protein
MRQVGFGTDKFDLDSCPLAKEGVEERGGHGKRKEAKGEGGMGGIGLQDATHA